MTNPRVSSAATNLGDVDLLIALQRSAYEIEVWDKNSDDCENEGNVHGVMVIINS